MKPFYLEATTISDAWFQLLFNIFDNSYNQQIQKGSFENEQYRLQYPGAMVYIKNPDQDIVPYIPKELGIEPPTTEEFNQSYFANYIMDPELAENETYKYASRIQEEIPTTRKTPVGFGWVEVSKQLTRQLDVVIDMLRKTPLTNQAVIEIAKPSDITTCIGNDGKLDPPCLRLIDFKAIPYQAIYCADCPHEPGSPCVLCEHYGKNVLTVSVYFRSWDLWAGFPVNLAGIEYLKQYVASECGLVNGPMYAYSAGLHIYGYQEKFARIRTMRDKLKGDKV